MANQDERGKTFKNTFLQITHQATFSKTPLDAREIARKHHLDFQAILAGWQRARQTNDNGLFNIVTKCVTALVQATDYQGAAAGAIELAVTFMTTCHNQITYAFAPGRNEVTVNMLRLLIATVQLEDAVVRHLSTILDWDFRISSRLLKTTLRKKNKSAFDSADIRTLFSILYLSVFALVDSSSKRDFPHFLRTWTGIAKDLDDENPQFIRLVLTCLTEDVLLDDALGVKIKQDIFSSVIPPVVRILDRTAPELDSVDAPSDVAARFLLAVIRWSGAKRSSFTAEQILKLLGPSDNHKIIALQIIRVHPTLIRSLARPEALASWNLDAMVSIKLLCEAISLPTHAPNVLDLLPNKILGQWVSKSLQSSNKLIAHFAAQLLACCLHKVLILSHGIDRQTHRRLRYAFPDLQLLVTYTRTRTPGLASSFAEHLLELYRFNGLAPRVDFGKTLEIPSSTLNPAIRELAMAHAFRLTRYGNLTAGTTTLSQLLEAAVESGDDDEPLGRLATGVVRSLLSQTTISCHEQDDIARWLKATRVIGRCSLLESLCQDCLQAPFRYILPPPTPMPNCQSVRFHELPLSPLLGALLSQLSVESEQSHLLLDLLKEVMREYALAGVCECYVQTVLNLAGDHSGQQKIMAIWKSVSRRLLDTELELEVTNHQIDTNQPLFDWLIADPTRLERTETLNHLRKSLGRDWDHEKRCNLTGHLAKILFSDKQRNEDLKNAAFSSFDVLVRGDDRSRLFAISVVSQFPQERLPFEESVLEALAALRCPLANAYLDRAIAWLVRRFAEDPQHSSVVDAFVRCMARIVPTLEWRPNAHDLNPCLEAGIQNRHSEDSVLELLSIVANLAELKTQDVAKHLAAIQFHPAALTRSAGVKLVGALLRRSPEAAGRLETSEIGGPLLAYRGLGTQLDAELLDILKGVELATTFMLSNGMVAWPKGSNSTSSQLIDMLASQKGDSRKRSDRRRSNHWDPTFSLPLLLLAFQQCKRERRLPSTQVLLDLVRNGMLGTMFVGLSETRPELLHCARAGLLEFMSLFSSLSPFREREEIRLISQHAHNLARQCFPARIPTVLTVFLARCLDLITSARHPLFTTVFHFLLQRAVIDPGDVPLLYTCIYSSSFTRLRHGFLLNLFQDSIRDFKDWKVLRRRQAWELCSNLTSEGFSDPRNALMTYEFLSHATACRPVARDLVLRSGLFVWLQTTTPTETVLMKIFWQALQSLRRGSPPDPRTATRVLQEGTSALLRLYPTEIHSSDPSLPLVCCRRLVLLLCAWNSQLSLEERLLVGTRLIRFLSTVQFPLETRPPDDNFLDAVARLHALLETAESEALCRSFTVIHAQTHDIFCSVDEMTETTNHV